MKICPLMSDYDHTRVETKLTGEVDWKLWKTPCAEEHCSWFNEYKQQCAINILSQKERK